MYKVYVKTDPQNRIAAINSDAFLTDTDGWTQIDEGEGDKFHHAQNHYLSKSLVTEEGICQYKLVKGKVVERTAEEIQADIDAIPPPPPSAEERIKALEAELVLLKPKVATLEAAARKTP